MSDGRMWFGTEQYMTWVPAFAPGSTVALSNYTESIKFVNGGGARTRSNAGQVIYNLDFPARDATGYSPWGKHNEGLDAFNRFASGYYGSGLCYLSDEMTHDMNVFPRAWATPSLIQEGWPNFGPTKPTFSAIPTPPTALPKYSATWTIPSTFAPSNRPSRYCVIPIPEDSYLAVGATGSATGGAGLYMERFSKTGTTISGGYLNLLPTTSIARTNTIVRGDQAAYVKIRFGSAGSGTITLNSLMGQIRPLTGSPGIYPSPLLYPSYNTWLVEANGIYHTSGDHIDGRGATGLMFADDAIVEEYVMLDQHLKGLSTILEEVGAWT